MPQPLIQTCLYRIWNTSQKWFQLWRLEPSKFLISQNNIYSASIVFRYLLHTMILINTLILRLCNIIVSQNTLKSIFWQDNARFLSKANSNTIHINFLLKRYLETLLLRIFFHSRFPSRPSGTTPLEKFS